jgi:hypothetical protein
LKISLLLQVGASSNLIRSIYRQHFCVIFAPSYVSYKMLYLIVPRKSMHDQECNLLSELGCARDCIRSFVVVGTSVRNISFRLLTQKPKRQATASSCNLSDSRHALPCNTHNGGLPDTDKVHTAHNIGLPKRDKL